jgi:hypothetical protein
MQQCHREKAKARNGKKKDSIFGHGDLVSDSAHVRDDDPYQWFNRQGDKKPLEANFEFRVGVAATAASDGLDRTIRCKRERQIR